MHELTLHVQSLGSKSYKELITMNSNNMHDKIADFIRFVGDWDFRHGEYYLASQRLEDLKACSKSLDILLDMGLEPYMKRQVSQVYKLLEELCWEIEKFEAEEEENEMYDCLYLRWRHN